ncbi:septum site-determining protein MinC [Jeongeupia chitinilytica]|uniref:Probable septum site-determining protein MinC n=1 Tax=Jeongeupia chitinilytica TaxID=1041641 RepID=A0ABQ3GY65_9NEIS|nr:septum site-determining protein MinC [Jeongeupia chitinilytica]GHD59352.1 putative septum site-determining protein MinC [Jeongeupia chitinilytica]
MPSGTQEATAFEFKSASVQLVSFVPATLDVAQIDAELREKLGDGEHMLSGSHVAIDFAALPETPDVATLQRLIDQLARFGLNLVAAQGGNDAQLAEAAEAGLIVIDEDAVTQLPTPKPVAAERVPAMIVTKPIRAGQQVYARGGDLVVLALVSNGAEVIADGSIHVYAPLRGRALAGARGDTGARVYTTCLEAELVSIAGVYRTLDEALPANIKSGAAQVRLDENKLVIEALSGLV